MNWAIKIISKTLMTKISHVSWGGYDKGFYGKSIIFIILNSLRIKINLINFNINMLKI